MEGNIASSELRGSAMVWQISTHDMRQVCTSAVYRNRRVTAAIIRCCFRTLALSAFLVGARAIGHGLHRCPLLTERAQTESEEDALAEEVNDPTAMLTQLRLFEFYMPENFRSRAQTNVALIQPIVPIARLSLLPVEQILRLTVKLSTTAIGPGGHTVTGLSDIQLYDLFQSQWPHLVSMAPTLGDLVRPLFFPTATDRKNGAGAW